MCRTPEIVAYGQDLPDGGQPSHTPPPSLLLNRQRFSYSPQYCPNSYYDPKTGKSYAMPKLKAATKRQYSLTPTCPFSKQLSSPATKNPSENVTQRKSITSFEIKESNLWCNHKIICNYWYGTV